MSNNRKKLKHYILEVTYQFPFWILEMLYTCNAVWHCNSEWGNRWWNFATKSDYSILFTIRLKTISCTCLVYSEEEKVKFLTIPILRKHVEKLLFFIVIYPNSFEHKRFVTVMKSTDKWQNPSPPLQLLFFTVHNKHRPAIIINILFGLVPLFSHISLCVY